MKRAIPSDCTRFKRHCSSRLAPVSTSFVLPSACWLYRIMQSWQRVRQRRKS